MATDTFKNQLEQHESAVSLRARAYRLNIGAWHVSWGVLLIVFFYGGEFDVWIERADLTGLLQIVTAFAAISLAILAFIHEVNKRDRFFKLILVGLTFIFLLAMTTGTLALLSTRPIRDTSLLTPLRFQFLIVGIIYVFVGLAGFAGTWFEFRYHDRSRAFAPLQRAYDYQFIVSPLFACFLWSSDASFLAATIALSIGGMIYLVTSTLALLVKVWGAKTHDQEVEEGVLNYVRELRARRAIGQDTDCQPVSYRTLVNKLQYNEDNIKSAVDRLYRQDLLVKVDQDSCYILEPGDLSRCVNLIRSFDILVLCKDRSNFIWTYIAEQLGENLKLPTDLVSMFMLDKIGELALTDFEKLQWDSYLHRSDHDVYYRPTCQAKLLAFTKTVDFHAGRGGEQMLAQFHCLPSSTDPNHHFRFVEILENAGKVLKG